MNRIGIFQLVLIAGIAGASRPSIGLAAALCPSQAENVAFVFGNGMSTSKGDALNGLGQLRFLVQNSIRIKSRIGRVGNESFELAYNPSEGVILQATQVAVQKLMSNLRLKALARMFVGQRTGRGARTMQQVMAPIDSTKLLQNKAIRKEVKDSFSFDRNIALGEADRDTKIHLKLYRDLRKNGKRVVLVSHSQGNFYSNIAYEILSQLEQDGIRQVMVATPTTYTADGLGRWSTFSDDVIMGLVRASTGALEGNVGLDAFRGDIFNHGFQTAYLRNSHSRKQIMDHIFESVEELFPESLPNVRVSLSWSGPSDVELYVKEPTDEIVYYKNLKGDLGDMTASADGRSGGIEYGTRCGFFGNKTFQVSAWLYDDKSTEPSAPGTEPSVDVSFHVSGPRFGATCKTKLTGEFGPAGIVTITPTFNLQVVPDSTTGSLALFIVNPNSTGVAPTPNTTAAGPELSCHRDDGSRMEVSGLPAILPPAVL